MKELLSYLPERPEKPRNTGVTMVMDKGLSVREAEDLVDTAGELIDFIKLGFGTCMVTNHVEKKIKIYQNANIKVYLGGTLFEAFLIRDKYEEFKKFVKKLKIDVVEVSDGSIYIDHDRKCELINDLSKDFTVLSEVGSKQSGILIAPTKWINMMETELQAGSFKVIAESRESGTVGIYRPSGMPHVALVSKILSKIPLDKILWESPQKSQQVWFIKEFGANVNLGNIAPHEIIPLETLRLGLRGDTFFLNLPEEMKELELKAEDSEEDQEE
ncbi:MAG: phosphosulfolactate synthase [Bacteroidales bacterium]|nr:phosphosulfolactate synthase [Bacteroidales bacterium]